MLYVILFAFGIGVLISNINKDEKIKESKDKISNLSSVIEKNNKKINELKNNVKKYNDELELKNKENKELKSIIIKLDKELETYTEIKRDSLNLNVTDDSYPQEEQRNVNEENDDQNSETEKVEDINPEKKKLFNIMNKTMDNIFITGKAGTGKSYLLKYFRQHTKKKVLYTAPTGIAALNISGVTLHSAFGFDNLKDEAIIKLTSSRKKMLKEIDTLVIDEISMVRVDVFEQIDKILKYVTGSKEPFGGKQIILFGDLFQLPPVAKFDEKSGLEDKYDGIFFFNSNAYKKGNFKFAELEQIFRQDDARFIKILNNIREGKIASEDIDSLNEHYSVTVPRRVVQIVPKKNEANQINSSNLNNINSKEYTYEAEEKFGKITESDFQCEQELKLKVGALVMLITNDKETPRRWVNGTLGIVSKLSDDSITVTINGKDCDIERYTFNRYKCEYDEEKKKLEYVVDASIVQFPLILSYAITIHKSQGQTYQQIACNLDNCFAPGQAYVALSRCAKFDKLYITSKVTPTSIITDKKVVNYYLEMKKNQIK